MSQHEINQDESVVTVNLNSVKRKDNHDYYAFLLDNIGPFPIETTQQLPRQIFDTIWSEFYHYLALVAETSRYGAGKAFVDFIENYTNFENLPNLSDITDSIVFDSLEEYKNKAGLDYWLNISALIEYGHLYANLSHEQQEQCKRFEYLQELDHFSEIMDLSLLTKHIKRVFSYLGGEEKEAFISKNKNLLQKYLGDSQVLLDSEEHYKPIAGRSRYMNVGLERMLGEAAAKRRNCNYMSYDNSEEKLGEYGLNYYPVNRESSKVEAQYKVIDEASLGLVRTNYPYLTLLLTSNSEFKCPQNKLKELSVICASLIMQYGLEIGVAMFDGYIFDNNYSMYHLSLIVTQTVKPGSNLDLQVKMMSIGAGAILIYQDQKIQHLCIRGNKNRHEYLGQTGTGFYREIITLNLEQNVKILLAPYAYGPALESMDREVLFQQANANQANPLAWLMNTFVKKNEIPKCARNILLSRIKPSELKIIRRPQWIQSEIQKIPEFQKLVNEYNKYLESYKSLEINVLYAHLHADRVVDIHQVISIDVASTFKKVMSHGNLCFKLQPLIDNLHVRDVFDYKNYRELLTNKNLEPDVILTEDSLLLDRIGQGILNYIYHQKSNDQYQIIFEGERAMNALYPDNTIVQLIDHMNKEGRLSCVTFDLAQIYYRQAPELFEKLFREDILMNYPDSILGKWFNEYPNKNYHQIMYEFVYTNSDIQYRNRLFQKITTEIRPNINSIDSTKPMRHYVDALHAELKSREKTREKKVISIYILEGSYDAQFDRYAKIHASFALPHIDTYRVTFTSEELGFNVMCIKS